MIRLATAPRPSAVLVVEPRADRRFLLRTCLSKLGLHGRFTDSYEHADLRNVSLLVVSPHLPEAGLLLEAARRRGVRTLLLEPEGSSHVFAADETLSLPAPLPRVRERLASACAHVVLDRCA
ncbi:MAG TPA: hypothetical protein DEA08_02995 [Planctomycetes bacterium]|nr:hypothetical protein [Planctomycetota bacterium]